MEESSRREGPPHITSLCCSFLRPRDVETVKIKYSCATGLFFKISKTRRNRSDETENSMLPPVAFMNRSATLRLHVGGAGWPLLIFFRICWVRFGFVTEASEEAPRG